MSELGGGLEVGPQGGRWRWRCGRWFACSAFGRAVSGGGRMIPLIPKGQCVALVGEAVHKPRTTRWRVRPDPVGVVPGRRPGLRRRETVQALLGALRPLRRPGSAPIRRTLGRGLPPMRRPGLVPHPARGLAVTSQRGSRTDRSARQLRRASATSMTRSIATSTTLTVSSPPRTARSASTTTEGFTSAHSPPSRSTRPSSPKAPRSRPGSPRCPSPI